MLPSAPESLPTQLRLTVQPGLSELEPARLAVLGSWRAVATNMFTVVLALD